MTFYCTTDITELPVLVYVDIIASLLRHRCGQGLERSHGSGRSFVECSWYASTVSSHKLCLGVAKLKIGSNGNAAKTTTTTKQKQIYIRVLKTLKADGVIVVEEPTH